MHVTLSGRTVQECRQMEYLQGQKGIAVIVTAVASTFLLANDLIIGAIKVRNKRFWGFVLRLDECFQDQLMHLKHHFSRFRRRQLAGNRFHSTQG